MMGWFVVGLLSRIICIGLFGRILLTINIEEGSDES